MLLPYILDQLDAELDRVRRLRAIVAGLQGAVAASFNPPPVPEAPPLNLVNEPPPVPVLQILPPRMPRRRGPRARPTPEAGNASFKPAPAGVFVVSPQQLERERTMRGVRRPDAPETEPTHSPAPELAPEALARTLAARWLSGNDGEGRGA